MPQNPLYLLGGTSNDLDARRAFTTLGVAGSIGAVLGAGAALFQRDEDETSSERARRVLGAGGRGAAIGLAGGLGALAYQPLAKPIAGAFSTSSVGNVGRVLARSAAQGALIGAAIGGYRAVIPQSDGWAKQPVGLRLHAFLPAESQSWAIAASVLGLATYTFGKLATSARHSP